MLRLEGLHTYYGRGHILQGVDLEVATGEIAAVLGRNGVGKTTTLRSIIGLARPQRGRVLLAGTDVDGLRAVVRATDLPVIASGGVGSLDDLHALGGIGVSGVIVGRALYEGAFTVREAVAALRSIEGRSA